MALAARQQQQAEEGTVLLPGAAGVACGAEGRLDEDEDEDEEEDEDEDEEESSSSAP